MKVRMDYVTNSSSVSYAVATVQALQQMLLLSGVYGLSTICGFSDSNQPPTRQDSDEVSASTPDADMNWNNLIDDNLDYDDKINKIENEINNYNAEWESIKDSLAEEDYDQVKSEYDNYIQYLNDVKDACGTFENEKILEQEMNDYANQYAADWENGRKNDIINVKNDIAEIKATISGYQANSIDTAELEGQLQQLQGYEQDLESMFEDENIEFTYTAPDMDPIPPSPEMIAIQQAHDQKMQQLLQQAAANEQRKDEIRAQMIQNAKDYQMELENAGFWGKATFIAEVISGAADMAVDVLATLTGPAGAVIKVKYEFVKNLGVTTTDVAWDPNNASQHLLKGSVKITTDLIKSRVQFPDGVNKKFFEYAVDMTNDMSATVIDEVSKRPKGETAEQFSNRLQSAAIKSTIKTSVNTGLTEGSKYFIPRVDVGENFGDFNASTFDKATRAGVKYFGEPLDGAASNAAKDFLTKKTSDLAKNTIDAVDKMLDNVKKGAKK